MTAESLWIVSQEGPIDPVAFGLFGLATRVHRLRQVAREQSRQYRGFRVAAELAAVGGGREPAYIDAAVNYPVKPGLKICAERGALWQVRNLGFDHVSLLLTTGDVQPDQDTGIAAPTLPLCREVCQLDLANAPEYRPGTLIVNVHLEEDVVGVYQSHQMLEQYGGGELPIPEAFHFGDPGFDTLDGALPIYLDARLRNPPEVSSADLACAALRGHLLLAA